MKARKDPLRRNKVKTIKNTGDPLVFNAYNMVTVLLLA